MADILLNVEGMKVYYPVKGDLGKGREFVKAVDGVSFEVRKGEVFGIVGESGCGKSTLGRGICKLETPTAGKIVLSGEDISSYGRKQMRSVRKKVQMVFQDPFSSINPRMTVSQIIGEPLEIYKLCKSKEEYARRVHEIMDTVGLASRLAGAYPHELDGGRRQRIGIGRALALNPKFIVCDEPVSALDVSIQAQVLNLMQDLQRDLHLTYIFITHDLSVVKHISDEILVMYLGTMVEKAESRELFRHQYHPYTQALLSAIPRPQLEKKQERILLKGEITSPIEPPPMCRFAPRCIYAKESCFASQPELTEETPNHFVACCRCAEFV